jgi:hypothetical protein
MKKSRRSDGTQMKPEEVKGVPDRKAATTGWQRRLTATRMVRQRSRGVRTARRKYDGLAEGDPDSDSDGPEEIQSVLTELR